MRGRLCLTNHGAGLVVEDEHGETVDVVKLAGVERNVVELSAQVRIAVLVELHSPVVHPGVDLDVGGGQGFGVFLPGDPYPAVAFRNLDPQAVRVIGLGLADAARLDLDHDVALAVLFGQGEDVVLGDGKLHALRPVGQDERELLGVVADEGSAGEQEFDLHRVVVDPDVLQVAVVDGDFSIHNLEVEGRFGCRQVLDLLFAVFLVDYLGRGSLLDLLHLSGHRSETFAPALDRVVRVLGGQFFRLGHVALVKGDVGGEIVVLQFLVYGNGIDLAEEPDPLVHTVLQEQVVGGPQDVVRIGRSLVLQDVEEAMVLLVETVVQDVAGLAEFVGPGVDQWFVLELLVPTALDGIDVQQRTPQEPPARSRQGRLGEEFPHAWLVLVVDGIGPQGGIEVKASGELLEHFLVEGPPAPAFGVVPEAECDLAQVEAVEVVVGQVPEDVLARAVLRNPGP